MKNFFFACAGIFLLMVGFALGASVVGAQQGATSLSVAAADWNSGTSMAGIVNRVVVSGYIARHEAGGYHAGGVTAPVPGTSPIIAVLGIEKTVILANGDVYILDNYGQWQLAGNMLQGVVSTASEEPRTTSRGIQASPNPTRGNSTLLFTLSQAGDVRVTVHDAAGRSMASRELTSLAAGLHRVPLSSLDESLRLEPGEYFITVQSGSHRQEGKLTIVR